MDFASKFTSNKMYGVYVHIPFCKAKCAYCAFVSSPDMSRKERYTDALVREISEFSSRGASVDTVYIGGGTPSCLDTGEIFSIFDALYGAFSIDTDAEITVEANPESCDDGFVRVCKDCGVNRVSMGLQSSNDRVLKNIGRIHSYSDFVAAAELLQNGGIQNISSDIILGLPDQTVEDIEKSIDTFSKFCTHASVYALSVEEGTPLYAKKYRPDDDAVADMYDRANDFLYSRGFWRYEVSNFARNGKYSRHNLKYWTFAPYIGFGVAAHGFDGDRLRYAHTDDIDKYISGEPYIYTQLTDADVYNEYIMLALRTDNGIDVSDFKARFGYDILKEASEALDRLVNSGLILKCDGHIRIAPDKMFVMNGIIEELMI